MHAQQGVACPRRASTCRSRSRSPTARRRGRRGRQQQRTGPSRWSGTRAASTPSHQWGAQAHRRGRAALQQMDADVLLPAHHQRAWPAALVDRPLLWHHAAHTVDLFHQGSGQRDRRRERGQGRCIRRSARDDMSIQLSAASGAIWHAVASCSSNDGPLRHVLPLHRRHRDAASRAAIDPADGKDQAIDVSKVDVSMNGIEPRWTASLPPPFAKDGPAMPHRRRHGSRATQHRTGGAGSPASARQP